MKRLLTLIFAAVMLITVAACGNNNGGTPSSTPAGGTDTPSTPSTPSAPDTFELALITDLGTIDDKSFNQGSWEGLKQYADEKGITNRYYQPSEQSDDAYLASIDLAVKGGAKLIVTPGFLFEVPIYVAQDRYPDVKFVLVDGTPHTEDYATFKTGDNTVGVLYAEEESGFLAGYAAVKDGNTKLGFMGGMAVPAVVRFGYGFVQGAEYAANEMGLGAGSLTINYHYMGNFNASPEAQTMAASWYNSGVEVIFACGGAVGNSVMAAAEASGAKVIGVDVDQSGESATVITSATKGLRESVYSCIKDFYDGKFPGGQNLTFTAANNGVGLPMGTSKFSSFTQADYDAVYAKLVAGSINIVRDDGGTDGSVVNSSISLSAVVMTEIN